MLMMIAWRQWPSNQNNRLIVASTPIKNSRVIILVRCCLRSAVFEYTSARARDIGDEAFIDIESRPAPNRLCWWTENAANKAHVFLEQSFSATTLIHLQ